MRSSLQRLSFTRLGFDPPTLLTHTLLSLPYPLPSSLHHKRHTRTSPLRLSVEGGSVPSARLSFSSGPIAHKHVLIRCPFRSDPHLPLFLLSLLPTFPLSHQSHPSQPASARSLSPPVGKSRRPNTAHVSIKLRAWVSSRPGEQQLLCPLARFPFTILPLPSQLPHDRPGQGERSCSPSSSATCLAPVGLERKLWH